MSQQTYDDKRPFNTVSLRSSSRLTSSSTDIAKMEGKPPSLSKSGNILRSSKFGTEEIRILERRVMMIAAASRIILFLWAVLCSSLVPDYDTSDELLDNTINNSNHAANFSRIDPAIRDTLRVFSHWDGVYFSRIAQRGYEFEQFHAFFPLFPLVIYFGKLLCQVNHTLQITLLIFSQLNLE